MKRHRYLTVRERLKILGEGGKIIHAHRRWVMWADDKSGKLQSEEVAWISSLPQLLFNNDIDFEEYKE